MAQVTHVVMGTVPYLSSTGAHSDCGVVDTAALSLPHVWWHPHADGAPTLLRDLAAQVFSLVPTSASGERSFKKSFRVHTRIRNRLSDGKADMTQAILFNKHQQRRFAEGVLLHPRCSAVEKHILYESIPGKRRLRP
jgi:hAT family C-terminal dimerisation region